MTPFLYRQPFQGIYVFGFIAFMVFIRLPCWLVYYSWRSNRPRKTWTLYRTINAQMIRALGHLPFDAGVLSGRDLSLEVPQEELEPLNARFVWIPELEKEDIVGMVEEHATRTGVKSVAVPAYWFLKEGTKWSTMYDKAQKDERVILYLHGGAFMVRFRPPSHRVFVLTFVADGDCTPIPPDISRSQGDGQTFHISFAGVIGRLPAHFRALPRTEEPVPGRTHRCNRGIQVSCL